MDVPRSELDVVASENGHNGFTHRPERRLPSGATPEAHKRVVLTPRQSFRP